MTADYQANRGKRVQSISSKHKETHRLRRLIRWLDAFVRCSISSYYQEGDERDEIERQKKYLVQADKGIYCHVERFSWDGEPSAMHLVDPIGGIGTE